MNKQDNIVRRAGIALVIMLFTVAVQAQQRVICWTEDGTVNYLGSTTPDENGIIDLDVLFTSGFAEGQDKRVFFRVVSTVDGVDRYGPTMAFDVYTPYSEGNKSKLVVAEYFWNEDPSFGQGTPIAIPTGVEYDLTDYIVNTSSLAEGDHLLGVRVQSTDGWGPTLTYNVYNPIKSRAKLMTAEYFWDEDPGFGQGTLIVLPSEEYYDLTDYIISTEGMASGDHLLGIRVQSTTGWGPTFLSDVRISALGDVNGDDAITVADLTALINIILKRDDAEPHVYDHAPADMNKDGQFTNADVEALVNLMLGR